MFLWPDDHYAQPLEAEFDSAFYELFSWPEGGFTGGDGTYSVLLPDGRTVWIFGDSFIGEVNPDSTRIKKDPMYVRNAFIVQDGSEMKTKYRGTPDDYQSLIIPDKVLNSGETVTEDSVWYWPGDGFIENGSLKIFLSEFRQFGPDMWDFEWTGTALVTFSLPSLTQKNIVEFSLDKTNGIHFGHAIYEADNYTYIYGLYEGKPYAARAVSGKIEGSWEYFSAGEWTDEIDKITPVLDVNGSEQFSVIKYSGSYFLMTQLGGFSNEIWAYKSDRPYSWKPENGKKIYTIELPFENENLFTYNALAHPQFVDKENRVLISYNTNSHRLQDHFDNAYIYRPRFIRVPLKHFD